MIIARVLPDRPIVSLPRQQKQCVRALCAARLPRLISPYRQSLGGGLRIKKRTREMVVHAIVTFDYGMRSLRRR